MSIYQLTWQTRFDGPCSLRIRLDGKAKPTNPWMNMMEMALNWPVAPTPWPREGTPTQPQCNSCKSGLPSHPHLATRQHMALTGTDGRKSIGMFFLFDHTYLLRCFHVMVKFGILSLQQLSAVTVVTHYTSAHRVTIATGLQRSSLSVVLYSSQQIIRSRDWLCQHN